MFERNLMVEMQTMQGDESMKSDSILGGLMAYYLYTRIMKYRKTMPSTHFDFSSYSA